MTYTHLIGPHDRFRTADCAVSYSLRSDGRVSLCLWVVPGLEQPFGFVPFNLTENVIVQRSAGVGVS